MSLKDILARNPNLTIADLQELQREYDERFIELRFSGFDKIRHTYAHMGKLLGRLATYVEAVEEGRKISAEDVTKSTEDIVKRAEEIKTKVIPDLLVYSAWLAEEFGIDMEQTYLTRFVGNLRRLYSNKIPTQELEEIERLVEERVTD